MVHYDKLRKQSLQKKNISGYCLNVNFAVRTLNKLRDRSQQSVSFLKSLLLSYMNKNLQETAMAILSGDEDYHHRHWKPYCRKVQEEFSCR